MNGPLFLGIARVPQNHNWRLDFTIIIFQRPENAGPQSRPNESPGVFQENRQLSYLRTEIAKQKSAYKKADCFSQYLKGCKFTAGTSPSSAISFSEQDVVELTEWALLQSEHEGEEIDTTPFPVKVSCTPWRLQVFCSG